MNDLEYPPLRAPYRMERATPSQLQEELERKDPSASGMISQQALAKALTRFGADFAGADLGRLMHRFDVHEVSGNGVTDKSDKWSAQSATGGVCSLSLSCVAAVVV